MILLPKTQMIHQSKIVNPDNKNEYDKNPNLGDKQANISSR